MEAKLVEWWRDCWRMALFLLDSAWLGDINHCRRHWWCTFCEEEEFSCLLAFCVFFSTGLWSWKNELMVLWKKIIGTIILVHVNAAAVRPQRGWGLINQHVTAYYIVVHGDCDRKTCRRVRVLLLLDSTPSLLVGIGSLTVELSKRFVSVPPDFDFSYQPFVLAMQHDQGISFWQFGYSVGFFNSWLMTVSCFSSSCNLLGHWSFHFQEV